MRNRKLEWDSVFFNLEIGEISSDTDESSIENDFQLIYFKTKTNHYFNSSQYQLTHQEQKVIFSKEIISHHPELGKIISLKDLTEFDLNLLYEIAFESGKFSRFKLDPNFEESHFKQFYKTWIDNSINGSFADEFYVFYENNQIKGLITIQKKDTFAQIGLLGVLDAYQGKGIGKQLVLMSENYCRKHQLKTLRIPTQMENRAACLFYEKMGYSIVESEFVKHYWKNDPIQ